MNLHLGMVAVLAHQGAIQTARKTIGLREMKLDPNLPG
jgi:hypothetical protein